MTAPRATISDSHRTQGLAKRRAQFVLLKNTGPQFAIKTLTVATWAESNVDTALSRMGTGVDKKKAADVSKAMREELSVVSVMVTPW